MGDMSHCPIIGLFFQIGMVGIAIPTSYLLANIGCIPSESAKIVTAEGRETKS
jgi:hypothetical protein